MSGPRDPASGGEPHPIDRDEPGLLDDIPPTGDLTPGDEASRAAEGGGIRQDPEGGPYVVDDRGAVVDTGSPQDYGAPNDSVERPPS